MKLSVIIPTFNRLELLQETLECVFGQTRPADEIIVVDDHSTDDTYEFLIAELAGKVIAIKCKGKGPGAARNTGLQAATGDLIKFFDSDDLMTRNLFEVQTAFLENSGESLVYSPYVHFSMENGVMTQRDVILQYRPIPKDVSLRDCVSRGFSTIIPSMMFRADFLKQVGQWRIDLSSYEDWDFLWRVVRWFQTLRIRMRVWFFIGFMACKLRFWVSRIPEKLMINCNAWNKFL
jgi:glycosyltransferase involved in cell wall biosynthesis